MALVGGSCGRHGCGACTCGGHLWGLHLSHACVHVQATVAFEKSQQKQKILEARSTAALKRCDALEHRSKQQAAALQDARMKRQAAEASVQEADERCDALAGRLIAAEAAAADARERAAHALLMRDNIHAEADAAREEATVLRSDVRAAMFICMHACMHAKAAYPSPIVLRGL